MTICHSLPCSIDYSGRASVDTYFRPASVSENGQQFQAASFRGRGLLAAPSTPAVGLILQPHDHHGQQQVVKGSFREMVEWHHTHQVSAIPSGRGRMQTAKDWMEVAAALHAPISSSPVDDDSSSPPTATMTQDKDP
jgi:Ribonuclease H2 non-catalytic subunit (Ylr154p-like)